MYMAKLAQSPQFISASALNCAACTGSRPYSTGPSSLRLPEHPRRPTTTPVALTALRHHASRARDGVRQAEPTTAREHEQTEAAAKATQQHSGPEGHQKEKSDNTDVSKVTEVSDKEQSRKDWEIIKTLLPNVWPKNDWGTKTRVLLAVGLLIGGKVGSTIWPCGL